jgi:serine/threonine-protein kinase ATR
LENFVNQGFGNFSKKVLDFEFLLGIVLLYLKKNDQKQFIYWLEKARASLVDPLASATMDSYISAYPIVINLHILTEIESVFEILSKKENFSDHLSSLIENFSQRFIFTQNSLKAREPILQVRKTLFQIISSHHPEEQKTCEKQIGNIWLNLASVARKTGQYQICDQALTQASRYGFVHLPNAKLLVNFFIYFFFIFFFQFFIFIFQFLVVKTKNSSSNKRNFQRNNCYR